MCDISKPVLVHGFNNHDSGCRAEDRGPKVWGILPERISPCVGRPDSCKDPRVLIYGFGCVIRPKNPFQVAVILGWYVCDRQPHKTLNAMFPSERRLFAAGNNDGGFLREEDRETPFLNLAP